MQVFDIKSSTKQKGNPFKSFKGREFQTKFWFIKRQASERQFSRWTERGAPFDLFVSPLTKRLRFWAKKSLHIFTVHFYFGAFYQILPGVLQSESSLLIQFQILFYYKSDKKSNFLLRGQMFSLRLWEELAERYLKRINIDFGTTSSKNIGLILVLAMTSQESGLMQDIYTKLKVRFQQTCRCNKIRTPKTRAGNSMSDVMLRINKLWIIDIL